MSYLRESKNESMYLTSFFGFLSVVAAVLGFVGIGYGDMYLFRIIFFVNLGLIVASFMWERTSRQKKYYD